ATGVEVQHLDAVAAQPLRALFGARHRARDAVAQPGQGVDEEGDRGAGADADHHPVFDVLEGLFAGQALGVAHFGSIAVRIFHCAALTGCTDRRLPLRISSNSSPSASARARMAASVTGALKRRTKPTSTSIQRGSSRLAFGSKYFDVRSNWVGSGYAVLATSARP